MKSFLGLTGIAWFDLSQIRSGLLDLDLTILIGSGGAAAALAMANSGAQRGSPKVRRSIAYTRFRPRNGSGFGLGGSGDRDECDLGARFGYGGLVRALGWAGSKGEGEKRDVFEIKDSSTMI